MSLTLVNNSVCMLHPPRRRMGVFRLSVGLLFLSLSAACMADDKVIARYFEQLRSRGLFSLAEGYCFSQLKREQISPKLRSQFTLELSRTFTEHAHYVSGEEQNELWARAESVVTEYLKENPQVSGHILFRIQLANIAQKHADWNRLEFEIAPENENFYDDASQLYQQSTAQWKSVERELVKRLNKVIRKQTRDEPFLAYQLRSILMNTRWQWANSLLQYAEMEPQSNALQKQLLLDAQGLLQSLKNGRAEETITWKSRLLLVKAARLRRDFKTATALVNVILADKPPSNIVPQLLIEQAQILADLNKPADAAQLIANQRRAGISQSGGVRFLYVSLLLASAEIAHQKQSSQVATELLKLAEREVVSAESAIGGFWAYRCRKKIERSGKTFKYGHAIAALVRRAEYAFQSGNKASAAALYEQSAHAATTAKNNDMAMELGYTHASILLQLEDYDKAAASFMNLANNIPDHKQTADAHLLGVFALGRIYSVSNTATDREKYSHGLTTHLQLFTKSSTAVEAVWMLATLQEHQLQIANALKSFQQIPADHPRRQAADTAIARCYESLLTQWQDSKRTSRELETLSQTAINTLKPRIALYPSAVQKLNYLQAEVLLRASRVEIHRTQPDYQTAESWLQRIIQTADMHIESESAIQKEFPIWKSLKQQALQLSILSFAGQEKYEQASAFIEKISQTNISEVLDILNGLIQLAENTELATQQQLGTLQLQAARALNKRRAELSLQDQKQIDERLAEAYLATGNTGRAIEYYAGLLKKSPRNKTILKTLARILQKCGTKECLTNARLKWRTLESLEKAGSIPWLTARYHVAECCLLLQQKAECRKLITVTKILYPKLGNEQLKKQFIQLQIITEQLR